MKFTTEILVQLYAKIREVCIAKWDIDPDYFRIHEDGEIVCYWTPNYNYADEESFEITLSDLNDDNLDFLIEERKRIEKEANEKRIEQQRIANEKRCAREEEERRTMYLKLKKEFEP